MSNASPSSERIAQLSQALDEEVQRRPAQDTIEQEIAGLRMRAAEEACMHSFRMAGGP